MKITNLQKLRQQFLHFLILSYIIDFLHNKRCITTKPT